ncbi:MAG: DUF192 domain-containing protein [Thermodesulfobacteriota bacterium]
MHARADARSQSSAILVAFFLAFMSLTSGKAICLAADQAVKEAEAITTMELKLGNGTIKAVVADTPSSRERGLLGWQTIDDNTGMLLDFVFEGIYAIHMQGMKFPIDAVWIDSTGRVLLIYENIQPNSGLTYPSLVRSRYCLELKAGSCKRLGVSMGEKVEFGRRDRTVP